MVADKPPGLLVVPTPKNEKRTLTSILNFLPCHRLDRETSGIIVYAKTRAMQDKMTDAFRQRKVKKRYIGFVQGFLKRRKGFINKKIDGREALTYYRVLEERKAGFSILDLEPVTGRTNQIRMHMKIIGHPIVGERKFAFGKDFALKFRRCCLHARYIEFNHPATNKKISFSADLPQDMKNFQKNLKNS